MLFCSTMHHSNQFGIHLCNFARNSSTREPLTKYHKLSTEMLYCAAEHLLDAAQSQPGAIRPTDKANVEKYFQQLLAAAAEKHCVRSGGSQTPASVLATLSNWFLVLQSPMFAPREADLSEALATQVIESPHPYLDSQELSYAIKPSVEDIISKIEYMEVVFDPRCRTETNHDFVTFWKDGVRQGLQKYHGHSPGVWAGVGPTQALRVQGSSMEARFYSDSNNNDWGYKFTVSFFPKPKESIAPFYRVMNPVFSCLPLMFFVKHDMLRESSPPDSLYKTFSTYLKALAALPEINVGAIFRSDQHDCVDSHLSVLQLMKTLGHCDESTMRLLFKKIYILACETKQELYIPPSSVKQDIFSEIGSVLAEQLTDSTLRTMIDKAFVSASAISEVSSPSSKVLFAVLACAIDCRARSNPESTSAKVVGSCSNKHPMTLCTSIPLAMMESSRGWICNVCNKHIPLFQTGIWYCETCS